MLARLRFPLLISCLLAVAFVISAAMQRAGADTSGLEVGVNCSKNVNSDPANCAQIGAKLARVEFDISNSATSLDALVSAFASRGIRVQLLAGFYARVPSTSESQNLRSWALRFGPGGSFWQGRSDGNLAVQKIEFGNETSYAYQYGDNWDSPSYGARAGVYAQRARDAATALQGTGVGLLVQADDANTGSAVWVNQMFAAVPDLDDRVAGWIVHPYGPDGFARLDRLTSQLAGVGASSSVGYFITEWGLASDNGRTLSDNYGYPRDLTYSQAATTLNDAFAQWQSHVGSRLKQVIIYQNADLQSSGASSDREGYFGITKRDGSDKGAYTTAVRAKLGASTTPLAVANTPPVAQASAAPSSGVAPLNVAYTSNGSSDSDGRITQYAWDLDGDGAFDDSAAQYPSTTYSTPTTVAARLKVTDDDGASAVSSPVNVTASSVTPPSGTVDLARGKPATASSSEGSAWAVPASGNDGNGDTRWSSSFAANQWWQVDLGAVKAVNAVEIAFCAWAWPSVYTISTSTDGSNWDVVVNDTLGASGGKTRYRTFAERTARYVRITGVERGTSFGTSIIEAKVFGTSASTTTAPPPTTTTPPPTTTTPPPTTTTPPPSGTVELAKGKPANASSSEKGAWFVPEMANDGNASTRWSSAFRDNEWWQVDLGAERGVSSVTLTFNQWAWPRTYTIATSPDGKSWKTVASESQSSAGTRTSSFATTAARYLRVTGVTRGTTNGTSIEDVKVFGTSSAPAPSPTPTAPPAAPTPVAPAPTPPPPVAPAPTPVAPPPPTTPSIVELAKGKPASASSSENAPWFVPSGANDGDTSTRWSSLFRDNEWWQVDLGAARELTSVQVTFNKWAWPTKYTVSVSADGSNWTTVATETPGTWGTTTSSFGKTSAKYVRITGVTRATINGISIEDAKVFGTE